MSLTNKPTERLKKSFHIVSVGLVCNVSLALIKTVTGILGGSYALIADGVESIMDIFSSMIVLGGIKIGARPADENHPYGHGRAESLAAMFVSIVLVLVAVRIAMESFQGIAHPRPAPAPFTLMVLVGVIVIKEVLFRSIVQVGHATDNLAVKTEAQHHRSDALTSLAAFVGISIALIGGPGYESADNWAALAASAVICFNGISLLKTAIADLMDQAPSPQLEQRVRSVATQVGGVVLIEKCRLRKIGGAYFVDIHVQVDGQMTVVNAHAIAHDVKDALIAAPLGIADVLVHIEPAL